ncbi:hypothetical protein MNBD_GAMMA07-2531 [hydrothermal vent metagenome]|uniref:Uncharacterized protein n=1 Tax=hydrothermal vent metagenome TaxID=652676 RepID=A0A3B0WW11_9ZZZZ
MNGRLVDKINRETVKNNKIIQNKLRTDQLKLKNSTNFPTPSIKKNTGISWDEAVKQKK